MTADNWYKIGTFQAYDYNLSGAAGLADTAPPFEQQISRNYTYVWAARFDRASYWRPFCANQDAAFYVPAFVDQGQGLWPVLQSWAWWLANHPSWISYVNGATNATQQSQNAVPFAGQPNVAIDFTNPAVVSYLTGYLSKLNTLYIEGLVPAGHLTPYGSNVGRPGQYTAIALDNVSLNNAGLARYTWNGTAFINSGVSGAWTGASVDYNYATDMVAYLGRVRTILQALPTPLKLIINISLGGVSTTDALNTTLMLNTDGCWWEQGFTNYGTALMTGATFAAYVAWIQNYWMASAKDFLLQHTFIHGGAQAEREYGLACYLLVKYPQMSMGMIPLANQNGAGIVPDYGVYHWYEMEYSTPLGYPLENAVIDQGVYRRHYSNGLVLICYNHASTGNVDYVLPGGVEYRDNYGVIYSGTILLDGNLANAKVLIEMN